MSRTIGTWGKELAQIWTNYLPPCRVSWSELGIYSKYLRILQKQFKTRSLKLLVLGSTSEFREWGHEENLDVTVVDYSKDYNVEIVNQMKYKNVKEKFFNMRWQDIDFVDSFHIVVGDLVIGNLEPGGIPDFLFNIKRALKNNGLFITKSFFQNSQYELKGLDMVFRNYIEHPPVGHPFSNLIYGIAMNCVDKESNVLRFAHMHKMIKCLYDQGLIDEDLYRTFSCLGWQENMKFGFYFPPAKEWENMAQTQFDILSQEKSADVYSPDFTVYVLKNSQILGEK